MKTKKYNDKKNIVAELIRNARESKNMTKTELSKQLELHRSLLTQK